VCKARLEVEDRGPIPKSGYNERIDHEYSTYDDVNGVVGSALAQAGIWHHSSVVTTFKEPSGETRKGNQRYCVTAVMEVYLTDGLTRMGRRIIGSNENAGDKHHYALESQLLRYALSKMLLLESGDVEVDQDPESGQGQPASSSSSDNASTGGNGTGTPASDSQKSTLQEIADEAAEAGVDLSDVSGVNVNDDGPQIDPDLTASGADYLFDELKKRKREARKQQAQQRAGQQTINSGEDDDGS